MLFCSMVVEMRGIEPRCRRFLQRSLHTYLAFLFKLKNSEASQIFFNRVLGFRKMFERAFPYPDNVLPRLIYRKSIRETRVTPKRTLERKRSHSYRSMERLPPSPWKLILQLSYWTNFYEIASILGMHQMQMVYCLCLASPNSVVKVLFLSSHFPPNLAICIAFF